MAIPILPDQGGGVKPGPRLTQHEQANRILERIMRQSDERAFVQQLYEDGMARFRRAHALDHLADDYSPLWQCPHCPCQVEQDVFAVEIAEEFATALKIAEHLDAHRQAEAHTDAMIRDVMEGRAS